jgi:arsenical pump membrane protein
LAIAIAVVATVLLAVRPWHVHRWVWPVAGALLVVLLGYEPIQAAAGAIARQWNVLLFILGLLGISAAAEESGAFAWIADVVLHHAHGSRKRLFVLLFLACALVTILLSNDATTIALTPIVYRAVVARAAGDVKPFLLGCVFAANAASFGLPFSNPTNVLILPHARLIPYLWHLGPPQIAAIAINLAVFLFFFRSRLRGRFPLVDPTAPAAQERRMLYALAGISAAYVIALAMRWPLGPVASLGALVTLPLAGCAPLAAARRISWNTLVLLAGLFVLLEAVTRGGLVQWSLAELDRALRYGSFVATWIAALGAVVLSNAFNNLPVAVAASYVVAHVSSENVAYPLIVGVDVGPNLTITGSLAGILWLSIVRARGVRVRLVEYVRLGAIAVPATIAASVLWLCLVR